MNDPAEPVLTAAEVAQIFGCSKDSIYAAVRAGEIPNVALGRVIRIPFAWVERRFFDAGAPLPEEVRCQYAAKRKPSNGSRPAPRTP